MAEKEVKKEGIVKVAKVWDECCYEIDHKEFYRLLTLNPSDNEEEDDDDDDEVVLVSEKGQVALRDFPHPRYLCGNFPFKTTSHESYCSKCFCCVCELSAPCCEWKGSSGHCHVTKRVVLFGGSEDEASSAYVDSEEDAPHYYYVDSGDDW